LCVDISACIGVNITVVTSVVISPRLPRNTVGARNVSLSLPRLLPLASSRNCDPGIAAFGISGNKIGGRLITVITCWINSGGNTAVRSGRRRLRMLARRWGRAAR
jgi:hypothetical protein